MALIVQSFDELSQEKVDEAYALVVQMVQEHDPTIDVKRGVLHDLVLVLSSTLAAANQENIDRVRRSNSLYAINLDSTLADDDVVNRVASNYKTSRRAGSKASGPIVVVMNESKSVIVAEGSIFSTEDGLVFYSDATYTSRTDEDDVVAVTDKLVYSLGNGSYVFTINVISEDIGSDYKLFANTALAPPVIDASVTAAYSASDFVGGDNPETNQELYSRLSAAVSTKSMVNRNGIEGLLRDLELSSFDSSFSVSTVGFGDAELLRYHSIFPVAFGGRADVYVRPQALASNTEIIKTATFVDTDGDDGVWQVVFTRNEYPGFYEVTRVTQVDDINNDAVSSYEITSDTRNYDISTGTTPSTLLLPDVKSAVEAAYSRYQTVTVRFIDTDTDVDDLTEGEDTAEYAFKLSGVSGLIEMQDAVSDRDTRWPIGDCLIKAAVPCFVSVTVNIGKKASASTPSTSDIKKAAANAVNGLGITNRLPASVLVTAVQAVLTANSAVTSVVLQGRLRRPDGTSLNYTSSTVLEPTTDTENMISARTVAFYLKESDVTVNVSNVDTLSS